ncbi:putative holin-like toxin [Listeria booriae]|uniref:Putative holin-like toxin n=1 Tax=Listeria booriae TaxID=1552123 RepID=A0A842A2D8_9LIST|nr:putative holin-like toxin [Listeria booriae]MBC1566003.1 putative holin-like toxin [Listeria booriae]MBC2188587.1 putative holin-like toxin [Listeria booriae]
MSVAEAIALMIGFGSFTVSLVGLVVVIVKAVNKDKE